MRLFLNIILLLSIKLSVHSQPLEPIDPNYFIAPMKIPVFLSGNFAELRPNHFHAGIDIKTQGKTGLPVYAAADGYISRIAISPSGYGNVIYIDHPNGTTTVYGHLSKFALPIEEYIRNIQYQKETFTIDQLVPAGILQVKKGELVAKSGNAGSSGGPHLHFEIRRTKEQILLNPLLFNMPVKDKIKPTIQALMLYPIANEGLVSGKQTPQRFETVLTGNTYQLKIKQPIQVSGKIGFGIQAIDLLDGSPNKCGIYSLKLTIDDALIYSFSMNDLVLDESKYINSHIDYEQAIHAGRRLYRTWLEPGNKLTIYDKVEKMGIFKAVDGQTHQVKYEIADASGNTTNLSFAIEAIKTEIPQTEPKGELFKYNHNNRIKNDELVFSVPEGALYDDIDFLYEKKPASSTFFSPVYQLHNPFVALHFACTLKIKATDLPAHLQSKAMLAQIEPSSGKIYAATGKYVDGWIEGNIRALGNYVVAVDTVAPKIVAVTVQNKKTPKDITALNFKLTDNLSGIDSFRGTIDGKWVLFEYDLKNKLISYTFDKKRFQFNKKHTLSLEVSDFKGNTSTYSTNFYK